MKSCLERAQSHFLSKEPPKPATGCARIDLSQDLVTEGALQKRLNQAQPRLTQGFRPILMSRLGVTRRPRDARRYRAPSRLPQTFSGVGMNKTELIDHIAQQADISKAAAGRALDAVIGGVKGTLKKGGSVTLVGFGTFAVGKRTARTGRNPRTGAAIKIKAAKVPKFRPGKALKDALN
ncbi:HU family DNA-binding protein [Paraburkholderia aspalathi]|uniref:HU family DNA-binding protein n=1 Tax=Paraburkholderia TaxID=1822464 RepID=UPI0027DEBD08|nr:HU family DNA-binding protein [Paraburkholderia aspalathi]